MTVRDPNDPGTTEFDFGDPELNDPDYESKIGGDDATADTTTDAVTQAQPSVVPEGVQQRSAADTVVAGTEQGNAGAPPRQQPDAQARVKPDAKGNLVDAQGNVVATAGAERRYYERVQQLQKHQRTLEADLVTAREQATLHGVLNNIPERLGLDARETELGLQVISSFKKDPVATARWALQETMKMGYNLAQIVGADASGQPVSGSMDLAAVKEMINSALAPLVGDRNAQQQASQADAAAQRDYDAFIANHENASVHESIIATMLAGDSKLTPEVAYWQLTAYAARNGLDFTKPLREQIVARQGAPAQQHTNGNAQPSSAQRQVAAMPNGSPMTADTQANDGMAAPDDSWDNIVQQSLREAGYH